MVVTVQNMHQQFKDELDKVDSLAIPNYSPTEIDRMLNQAQETFIRDRLPKSLKKATTVEETERRMDDLSIITRNFQSSAFASTSDNKPNGTFITWPADYKYCLDEEVSITTVNACNETVTKRVRVLPKSHDNYQVIIDDPFAAPDEDVVIRLNYGPDPSIPTQLINFQPAHRVELISSPTVTLSTYYMRYLRQPQQIDIGNQTCELSETAAIEIVKLAVADVLRYISDPRYQAQKYEISTSE